MQRDSRLWAVALLVFGLGIGVYAFRPVSSTAQQPGGGTTIGPKYTVVETEGTNLLVVDNSTNTMHFYTVDPGKEVGEELHLRGSIDLNAVGKPTIKPKVLKKANTGGGQ
jgi:hypothetical protein